MDVVLLIARICLAAVFLISALHKAQYFDLAQEEFRKAKVPFSTSVLICVIVLHFLASISLITGVYATYSAYILAAFMLVVTFWVHDFWSRDGKERLAVSRDALANLAIFGGLLLAGVTGPGKYVLG